MSADSTAPPTGAERESYASCSHPADHRCIDCATDDEIAAAIPPFPGGTR